VLVKIVGRDHAAYFFRREDGTAPSS